MRSRDDINAEISELVERLSHRRNPGSNISARRMLEVVDLDVIDTMAVAYLTAHATDLARERTLAAERRAEQEAKRKRMDEAFARGKEANRERRRKLREHKEWLKTPEGQRAQAKWDAQDAEAERRANMTLNDVIDEWKQRLRMEWTQELLDSGFALPDGTRTTWGDATVAQHRARVLMFRSNAKANLEGAARHECAIDALEQSGAKTLRVMVRRAAS